MSALAKWKQRGARASRFVARWYGEFIQNNGLAHAGNIAFFGLLSILPFSMLAVSLIAKSLARWPYLLGESSAAEAVLAPLRRAVPFMDSHLDELITSLANANTSLSIVSVLSLVYAASAGFEATSDGINAALETERKRRFILTKLLVAALVILSIGGLLLWSLLSNVAIGIAGRVSRPMPMPGWVEEAHPIQTAVEFIGISVGHYVVVHMMSTERVPRSYRWLSAVVFAFAFEVARWGLAIYLREVASYDKYYGAAGAFFGLCLWIYVVSIVLIFSTSLMRLLEELSQEGAFDGWRERLRERKEARRQRRHKKVVAKFDGR